ncbi:MAG: hypothetical protein IPL26_28085 [Leptospiraceae bacterium]|nr:hypothetical protein [Leptospiraceae bacterium]
MKLVKGVLLNSIIIILFFANCTAWPALIPVPPGKSSTAIYPIPLPGTTTTAIPALRITDNAGTVVTTYPLIHNGNHTFKTINSTGSDVSATTTWAKTVDAIATVGAGPGTGLVTASNIDGTTTITATNTATGDTATLALRVNATGTSILAFDGKNFFQLNQSPNQNTNEEK